ncbi:MAG: PD40 domain-containing protein [Anaerolineales bacterium]|nr:PD40 domain-containing protein [Anaerolineales bacterium]
MNRSAQVAMIALLGVLTLLAGLAAVPVLAQTPPPAPTESVTMTTTKPVSVTISVTPAVTITASTTVTPAADSAFGSVFATVVTPKGQRLHIRSGPGANYPIVDRAVSGQVLPVLARDSAGAWLLVARPGVSTPAGWISTQWVTVSAPIKQLPVSNVVVPITPSAPVTTTAAVTVPGAVKPVAVITPVAPVAVAPVVAKPYSPPPGIYGKLAVPVFDTNRQRYDIWMVNADGTGLHSVVENASAPALSYDGRKLAYRNWRVDDRGVVIANADGSGAWRVTDKLEDTLPSFSPDARKVAFSSYRESDRRNRLYYAWTDEQNRRAWEWGAGNLFGEDPYWMLDNQITYGDIRLSDMQQELKVMSGVDASGQQVIWTTRSLRAPAAARDNRTVAFMSFDSGNWDLYSIDLVTRKVTQLTTAKANDGLPTFSPNGEFIAFVSDRTGAWGLWVMNADGSNQQLLTKLPGPVDGRVIFEPDYLNNGWLEEQIAWAP